MKQYAAFLVALLVTCMSTPALHAATLPSVTPKVVAQIGMVCLLDYTGVSCWESTSGDSTFHPATDVPRLDQPYAITSGVSGHSPSTPSFACTLDLSDIHCWGPGAEVAGVLSHIPKVDSPLEISANENHVCVLGSRGVPVCWGRQVPSGMPPLGHVIHIAAGADNDCAIEDTGAVDCWGNASYGIPGHYQFDQPTQISIGTEEAWVLDSKGLHSIGQPGADQPTATALNSPFALSHSEDDDFCVLSSSDQASCWGHLWKNGASKALSMPTSVTIAYPYFDNAWHPFACALDVKGLECWYSDGSALALPGTEPGEGNLGSLFSNLNSLPEGLDLFTQFLPKPRAQFLSTIAQGLREIAKDKEAQDDIGQGELRMAGAFTLMALKPFVHNLDAQAFVTRLYPGFDAAIERMGATYGVRTLNDIGANPLVRLTALRIIQAAVTSLQTYATTDADSAELKALLVHTGQILAEPSSWRMQDLARTIEGSKLIQNMSTNPLTRPIALPLAAVAQYLGD